MLFLSLFACAPTTLVPLGDLESSNARVWLQQTSSGWSLFSDVEVPVDRGCGDLSDLESVTFNGESAALRAARKIDGECEGPQASIDLADFEGELSVEWVAESGTRALAVKAATGPTNLRLSSPENGIVDADQDIVLSWDSPPSMEEVRVIAQGPDGIVQMFDGDSVGTDFIVSGHPIKGKLGRLEFNRMDWVPSISECPDGWSCNVWDAIWDGPMLVPLPAEGAE
ncbi:MAG: hypothetical protein ACI9VR_001637 [Cognaticolwellia sp.]|jgi:hypothetical protein